MQSDQNCLCWTIQASQLPALRVVVMGAPRARLLRQCVALDSLHSLDVAEVGKSTVARVLAEYLDISYEEVGV